METALAEGGCSPLPARSSSAMKPASARGVPHFNASKCTLPQVDSDCTAFDAMPIMTETRWSVAPKVVKAELGGMPSVALPGSETCIRRANIPFMAQQSSLKGN